MTPERLERINTMLDKRQPDLTVCMEGVHKTHNLAAVVRTCDAIGVSDVRTTAAKLWVLCTPSIQTVRSG